MSGEKKDQDRISLVENIIDVADVDTVFRDIYIEHAKDLLSDVLTQDDYKDIIREKNELELDPAVFKLVCIPSDIYLRLGEAMDWGNQEIWTHFDGYGVFQHNRFNAMAGGDKRFGGIYDLVTIGREYESDHVITRFANVQRKRMQKLI